MLIKKEGHGLTSVLNPQNKSMHEGQLAIMMDMKHTARFREVKYFHPFGKPMPNGSHYQRGGFLNECKINKESFLMDEGVHNEQYGMNDYRGGFVVFSTDVNAVKVDANILINTVKQLVIAFNNRINKPEEIICAYSVGNFFKGEYVGGNGEMYDANSLSVEINGLSSRSILLFAELLAQEFIQETVLVKDLNMNKIYLADSIPMPSARMI